jgi:hypothetical protein
MNEPGWISFFLINQIYLVGCNKNAMVRKSRNLASKNGAHASKNGAHASKNGFF